MQEHSLDGRESEVKSHHIREEVKLEKEKQGLNNARFQQSASVEEN